MLPKQKRTGKIALITAIIVLIALLAFDVALRSLAYNRQCYNDWASKAAQIGPWTGKSIWISDDNDIYLISERISNRQYNSALYPYVYYNNEWHEVDSFSIISGLRKAELTDGVKNELHIKGDLNVKEHILTISECENLGKTDFLNGRNEIIIREYDYNEKIDSLPFQHNY